MKMIPAMSPAEMADPDEAERVVHSAVSSTPARSGDDVALVYTALRRMILDGVLEPGVHVAQAQLAAQIGSGRTPLREALRMLQQEGLVLAVRNKGIRIAPIDLEELDCIYGFRVAMEAAAARLTVPAMTEEDLSALAATMAEMKPAVEQGDRDAFEQPHRRFHQILAKYVHEPARCRIDLDSDRAERYRRLLMRGDRDALVAADREHQEIVAACHDRDGDRAAMLVADHLARAAFRVAVQLDLTFNPVLTRNALAMVLGPDHARFAERRAGLGARGDEGVVRRAGR